MTSLRKYLENESVKGDSRPVASMWDAIGRIEKFAKKGRNAMEKDVLLQKSILQNLLIIAKAATAFTPKFKTMYPEVNWSKVEGMQIFLIHPRPDAPVNLDAIWDCVQRDIPVLKKEIRALIYDVETQFN